jgi:hypothetical protein
VAAGERLEKAWRARERPPGERKEVGAGRGRRVEGKPAGGGAIGGGRAAAGAKHCRRQASRVGTHVREEEEERGEVRGTSL